MYCGSTRKTHYVALLVMKALFYCKTCQHIICFLDEQQQAPPPHLQQDTLYSHGGLTNSFAGWWLLSGCVESIILGELQTSIICMVSRDCHPIEKSKRAQQTSVLLTFVYK